MLKKLGLLAIAAIFVFNSCNDETTVFVDDLQEDVVLENSETKLQSSISFDKSGVLDILEEDKISNKSSRLPDDAAGDYPLTLVAQVNAPSYSGRGELTASHVHVDGNYAYVSYNSVGEEYFGAIDIVNIGNPNNPRVTSRVFYLNADINAVVYEGGFVYIAGGVDAETSATATTNSFVAKLHASNGRFDLGAGISYGFQQGFNANDLRIKDNLILVTSGKDGSLTAYNKNDLQIQNEVPFDDLRSLATDGNNIALLNATSGVSILDGNLQPIRDIAITGTDFGDFSKKSLDIQGDRIVVAEAGRGAGVYSFSSGALLEHIPILINPEGVDSGDIVTNAVASNDKLMLMANGGAGLCLTEENGTGTDLFGIIQLEGSINYVASKGDYIFAASGREGLQIIKLNRPSESLSAICNTMPSYNGSDKMLISSGENEGYRDSKRLNNINNSGSLLLCGSWTVRNNVSIRDNALFEMNGNLIVGRNNRRRNITLDEGSTFRVEGNLIIYGDLILNDGTTLEFIGDKSVVNIFGNVVRNGTVTITGDFEDARNKF